MTKIMIDCGNCVPDFTAIQTMVCKNFKAEVIRTHGVEDTIAALRTKPAALVTINRKLDADYSDGLEVIKAIKAEADITDTPVMLITNYEEHQTEAVCAGAVRGFGKLALQDDATKQLLSLYLT